jgi:DNA-binding IclR family transcriptional regulator
MMAAVDRAADLLLYFARSSATSFGISETARELGMTKGTVHRVLAALVRRNLVVRSDDDHRYALGPATVVLGRAFMTKSSIGEIARHSLDELAAETGQTCLLWLSVNDQVYSAYRASTGAEQVLSVGTGSGVALHANSPGRAYLALCPPSQIASYLDRARLTAPGSAASAASASEYRVLLQQDLDQIRLRGYAVPAVDTADPMTQVAAPVLNGDGVSVAAISMLCSHNQLAADGSEFIGRLLATSMRLSADLGYRS